LSPFSPPAPLLSAYVGHDVVEAVIAASVTPVSAVMTGNRFLG
jgi:hypothetical protein